MAGEIVHMSGYRWEMMPEDASPQEMGRILEDVGFMGNGEGSYVKEIIDWKDLTVHVQSDKMLFEFYWPGTSVTSKYYDYLLHCGKEIRRVEFRLELLGSEEK